MNGFANEIVREDRKGEDLVPDLNGSKVRPRPFPSQEECSFLFAQDIWRPARPVPCRTLVIEMFSVAHS